jgi:putative molybdopterin biosynthesis protein
MRVNASVAAAVSAWLDASGSGRLSPVTVPIAEALGRVLAEPVWALRSSPAFPAAAMDGIAVCAAATKAATPSGPVRLAAESFDVVDTGNPLPAGRDAVVVRERVRIESRDAVVEEQASPGQHVRAIGEDIVAGELLLAPGHRVRPVDMAAAAAAGIAELTVRRPAVVSILPTGDELRPAGASLKLGELADTNSLMLDGLAREAGCETRVWPILPDDPDRLAAALVAAAAQSDLVLLVAGTSAGRHDYAPEVLRRRGRIVVRGVAMRPGHPAILGVVERTPVMACPGYPVSAALAFGELAVPLIASLEGVPARPRPAVRARLAGDVRSKQGTHHLVRVRLATVDGGLVAMPVPGGASVLTSLVHADALVAIPADRDLVPAAAGVDAELLPADTRVDGALLLAGAPDHALELLALAVADSSAGAGPGSARIAFCELSAEEAVARVRDGMCHAAAVAGDADSLPSVADGGPLIARRLADCDVGLSVAPDPGVVGAPVDVLRSGVRVVVGPHGTPARRVLEEALRDTGASACEIVEARSDAAAVAAVAAGYGDCVASSVAAAQRAGLEVMPLGRAALDLVIHRAVAERDPAVRALLDAMRSRPLALALERAGYGLGAVETTIAVGATR